MFKQAVVLAGGLGTRLYPLTKDIPKPMVEVAGRPFLHWQLEYLKGEGITEVVLLVSRLGHVIKDYFKSQPIAGIKIKFSEEPEPMGTGGALKLALPSLQNHFWLVNGDSFLKLDLNIMSSSFENGWQGSMAALADLSLVPVPANLKISNHRVVDYKKGAGSESGFTHVDAGLYILSKDLIENGPDGKFDIESYWPHLIQEQKLGAFEVTERFFDIGTPERLKTFEEHIDDYF